MEFIASGMGHTMEANDCGEHGGQVKVKSRAIYVNRKWQLNLMATSFGLYNGREK